ncbi:hypothetical protein SDC9_100362 [bioreactor metagenome]|uniref:Uncharacterized protein n=1 Tax=bioreactor metagenome TaxID=1076179 RepID=A0A645AVL9_9ZZZZ
MHAPLGRMDVVGKGGDDLAVGVGVLHGHLGAAGLFLVDEINNGMEGVFLVVDVFHKRTDAPLV